MAGNSIKVDTDQVAQIAANIEGINNRLTEILVNSKVTIDRLSGIWEGDAAQATISSFDDFAARYFNKYSDVLAKYVAFLRVNIEQGHFETETKNVSLANAFK